MAYKYHGHDHKKVRKVIFFEFILICLAVIVSTVTFNYSGLGYVDFTELLSYRTIICIVILQLCILALGLYDLKIREDRIGVFRRIIVAVAISFFLIELYLFQFEGTTSIPRYFLLESVILTLVFLTAFRMLLWNSDLLGVTKRNVVVIGAGERASIIEKRMRRAADRRGIEVLGFVRMKGDKENQVVKETILNFANASELEDYVYHNDVSEVVVAADERRGTMPVESLFNFKLRGVEITDILDFIERETGQVAVTLIYPSWVIYSNGFKTSNYLKLGLGYLFNFTLAMLIFAVTLPVILFTILAIFLDDGWKRGATIFYRQERVGKNGRIFHILKFRSMKMDAEAKGAQFAQSKDSRVTRLGEFIRKYRIDELPQLFNVIKGDMAFVGPRPERPEFVTNFIREIPYYNQRHNVKPGLTGWAQLNYPYGASTEDTIEKLKFDLYYIKHSSILLDLLILLRTAEVVLFGKGR